MTKISTAQLRKEVTETINRVFYANERVVVEKGNKKLAVILPYEEYSAFCRYQDLMDLEAIRKSKESGGKYVDIETIGKELGLNDQEESGAKT